MVEHLLMIAETVLRVTQVMSHVSTLVPILKSVLERMIVIQLQI